MILFPHCKINLGLNVLRRRTDGYHDIETLFYPVKGLYDVLELFPSDSDGIDLMTSGADCGPIHDNLCLKAYHLMRDRFADKIKGVTAYLHKSVPSGAGLGGGSSDAAFMLKGLNELFGLGLNSDNLMEIAALLGSDVPYFINAGVQLASKRGDVLKPAPAPQLKGMKLVIVKPPVHVSTAEAYSGIVPSLCSEDLCSQITLPVTEWRGKIKNDFEPSVFSKYPRIAAIKEALYRIGALYVSMSGSGSAIYGLFDSPIEIGEQQFSDCLFYSFDL